MKTRPIKSLAYAARRIKELESTHKKNRDLLDRVWEERNALAKLAADGPAFYNPIEISRVKKMRDEILRQRFNMNPDGSPITKGTPNV